MWRKAHRRGFHSAIQIVVFHHAAERHWEVAKDLLRDDRGAVETWAEARN